MNDDMSEDLAELDAMFADLGGNDKVEENANDFASAEDGTYEAEVINAELTKSKAGLPMIKIEYGLETKQHVWQYLMLAAKPGPDQEANTKRQMSRTINILRSKYGIEAETVSGYTSQLDKLEGRAVVLTLSTKNDFQNISIDEVKN